jgi:hypothetical protein
VETVKPIKKIRLKGKELLSRLTGISIASVAGISWKPPVDERGRAYQLLVFLEDRRVLYNPHDMENAHHMVQSVLEIRKRLTSDLESIDKECPLKHSLAAMQAACRKFLDETQETHGHGYHLDPFMLQRLGELRALFGVHVAILAASYDLEVEGNLLTILPPAIE